MNIVHSSKLKKFLLNSIQKKTVFILQMQRKIDTQKLYTLHYG